jgi:hypothetical protein
MYNFVDRYSKLYTDVPSKKQGGTMNKYQQGGAAP